MKIVGNQKIVCLQKAETNKDNLYGIVNKECMYRASQNLGYNEFRIYMYVVTNADKYEFALSTTDIANCMGANKRNIQKSINILIEKGYLVQDSANRYIFRENISSDNECVKSTVSKEHSEQKTHSDMSEKLIVPCAKNSQDYEQKTHRNITEYYNKSTLDSTDATLNDQTNERPEIENFINIDDVPDNIIQKVISLYQDGKKYKKKNPQIQNETGLSGKIIFQIIEKYKNGEISISKKDTDSNVLWFDSGNECIDIQTIKKAIIERNISELDEKAVSSVYEEYYEVSSKYCSNKEKIAEWFEKNFNYIYSKKEDALC